MQQRDVLILLLALFAGFSIGMLMGWAFGWACHHLHKQRQWLRERFKAPEKPLRTTFLKEL